MTGLLYAFPFSFIITSLFSTFTSIASISSWIVNVRANVSITSSEIIDFSTSFNIFSLNSNCNTPSFKVGLFTNVVLSLIICKYYILCDWSYIHDYYQFTYILLINSLIYYLLGM